MNPSSPIRHLPRYASNPLIARLPPEEISDEAMLELLSGQIDVPTDETRGLPAQERLYMCEDLLRLQIALNRDFEFAEQFGALVREGYMDRLPGPGYWRSHNPEVQAVLENAKNNRLQPVNSRCVAVTGITGSGKTRVVHTTLRMYPQVITHDTSQNPLLPLKQVVWVIIDFPSNRSLRALCKRFFRAMGEAVGEPYEQQFGHGNVDEMLSDMARLAREHFLGVLVIDEIQHALGQKGAASPALMRFVISLGNELRMPVLFIGTTKVLTELRQRPATSRRLIGLTYDRLHENDRDWDAFITELWLYQYTRTTTELTDELRKTLYDLTQGIPAFIIALFVFAQRRAISRGASGEGDEHLDSETFISVYREYFTAVDPVIQALRSGDDQLIGQFEDLPSRFSISDMIADQTKAFLARELKAIDRAVARGGKAVRRQVPGLFAHAAKGLEKGVAAKVHEQAQTIATEAKKAAKAGDDPVKVLEQKGLIKEV